ncbi:MAG: efflux RND transporter periplasmic adaptor subunit [Wenzhouxiangellaceae bacterium]
MNYRGIGMIATAMVYALLSGCNQSSNAPAENPPPPVTVAKPVAQQITDWDEYTGRLEAVDEVEVRARVSGYLESIHFEDGELVNKGDLLFVIDPRPFVAVRDQAQATVAEAQARLRLAESEAKRGENLYEKRAISEEERDNRAQALVEARAALEGAQAMVTQSSLNVEFTEVRAPISGRISRKRVTEGNLINGGTADSTLLTTIVSLDPIYLYFTADERAYLHYVRLAERGQRPSSRDHSNPVRMQLADEEGFPHVGRMDFVDNEIDEATGTMEGRAIFDNPDRLLIPGLFARLQLLGEGPYEALLVPDSAIGMDQAQRIVYVLNDDNTVRRQTVKIGKLVDGMRVIREGLSADDEVVVKGLMRVQPGNPVTPQREDAAGDQSAGGASGGDGGQANAAEGSNT